MDMNIIPETGGGRGGKPLNYPAILDELKASDLGEKYFWRQHYSDIEPNYNAFHGKLYKERKRRERQTEVITINTAPPIPYFPPPRLEDLDDTTRWLSDLNDLTHSKRYLWVMHAADMHEPFSHTGAKECAYMLASLIQPDVIVRGSDEDDNPTISVFAERDGEAPDIGDFLDTMEQTRHYNTRRFQTAAPNALQINIEGNHGYPRFKAWVNKKARESKPSLTRRYVENVRCGGDVFFIGFKESVKIHPALLVMHGRKWGDNAPRQTLQLRQMGVNIMAGHSHKPGMYTTVQANGKPVSALISGCLCDLNPHYAPLEDDEYTTWQHSTGVAFLDTHTGIVDMMNVMFHTDALGTWFTWGGKVYRYHAGGDLHVMAKAG